MKYLDLPINIIFRSSVLYFLVFWIILLEVLSTYLVGGSDTYGRMSHSTNIPTRTSSSQLGCGWVGNDTCLG